MLMLALMRTQPPADLLLLPRGLTYMRLWFRSTYAIDIHFRFANSVVLEGMRFHNPPLAYTHAHIQSCVQTPPCTFMYMSLLMHTYNRVTQK